MAEIIHDGFGWLGPGRNNSRALYSPKWDTVGGSLGSGTTSLGPRFTGGSYFSATFGSDFIIKNFPGNRQHVWVGFAYTGGSGDNNATNLFSLFDGLTQQVTVMGTSLNFLQLKRGSGTGTVVEQTPVAILSPVNTTWDYYEFEFFISSTAGFWKVWKNNQLLYTSATTLNLSNSGNAFVNAFMLGTNIGFNQQMCFTDVYVVDDQAGGGPTSRVGDSRMVTLLPTGAGAFTEWTPSTGSNWQNVDDAPANDDTDYNASLTVGARDRYTFQSLPSTITGNVISVTHGFRAKKDDAGVRTIAGNIRSSTSETAGATQSLSTGYQTFADTIWTDPNGGGALTPTVVNALQAGPDVIS